MRKMILAAVLSSAISLGGCATVSSVPTERLGTATLYLANGAPAGTAQLLDSGDDVDLVVALAGLSPGVHGVHLHTTGSCEAPDFTSAGGHLNPTGNQHGLENPAGPHLGDLPNVTIGASGTGTVTTTLRGTRAEVLPLLFDTDGTAVVVHAGPDDYRSDPAGDAGSRVACGVIQPR